MVYSDSPETLYHKKDIWGVENRKYSAPHYRLLKSARIINKLAGEGERTLLDVGCGPGTLRTILRPNIRYHGIDISIPEPAPNLIEKDILESPIDFEGKRFDIVIAQGFFEYMGEHESAKFSEITQVLNPGGIFVTSYVNFDHHRRSIYGLYNNVQPMSAFRADLTRYFTIRRCIPTSHNWEHSEPSNTLVKTLNMHLDLSLPLLTRKLAVENFFICSSRPVVIDNKMTTVRQH